MSTEDVLKFPQKPKADSKIAEKLGYFSSPKGQLFSHRFMSAVALGTGLAFYSTQTLLIDKYLDFIRAYRNGLKVEVPERIEALVDKAADIAKLPPRESVNLRTFVVSGFDILTYGTMNSTYYGWVGVPLNYFYNSTLDIDRLNLKLRNESIDWSSKAGVMLEKSLVLTEDEKLFGITRSVFELRNQNHIHSTLIPTFSIFGLYVTAQRLNNRFNLFLMPRMGRILIYGLLSAFTYGIYTFVTDTIRIQQTARVDKQLAACGTEMVEAGIRFYEKVLNKNIAIRELSGQDLYSVKGNEYPSLLRFNVFPLTTRKKFFEGKLEELQKKADEEKNAAANTTQANVESEKNANAK